MIIREARAADWTSIWPFFAAIVAAGESYVYPENLTEETGRPLWMDGHVVVAEDEADGAILGSAKMGPNKLGRGDHVATASFMVDPARHRHGIGRALGQYALDWARSAGFHGMQFNAVVQTNEAAVRLWQSLGFAIIGTVPQAFRSRAYGLVGLHIMYQRLVP